MRSKPGRPPTFTESARREQFVACAIEAISEIGYPQLSIRKVAERAGVAMSVVLYHFGSKDNLVDAIVETMCRSALALVGPAVDAETTAAGKLGAYIRATLEYFDTHRGQLAALAQIGTSHRPGGERGPGLPSETREQLAALDPKPILLDGQRNGEFGDFPADSVAIALRGAVNASVEKILAETDFDPRAYGEDVAQIFGRFLGSAL